MSWKEVYRLLGRHFIDDTGINWKEAVMGSIDGRSRRPMYPRGSWMARNADLFRCGVGTFLVLISFLGANQLFFRFFYTQPVDFCACSRPLQLIVYFIFSWGPRRPFRYRLTPDSITYANSNDPSRSLMVLSVFSSALMSSSIIFLLPCCITLASGIRNCSYYPSSKIIVVLFTYLLAIPLTALLFSKKFHLL